MSRKFGWLAVVLMLSFPASETWGQVPGGGTGGTGGTGGNAGGVIIDTEGVLRLRDVSDASSAAELKRAAQFAAAQLPADLILASPARTLSLKKLDETLREIFASRQEIPLPIRYLGGLQRVDQIVFLPAEKDVLIIGPAEGFGPNGEGRIVGLKSGRPPLQLDDLVTALRAVTGSKDSIGCSIDPDPTRLRNLNQYLAANSSPASEAVVQQRYRQMSQVLGRQNIRLWGVPDNSHFALGVVEADYRMKGIALGAVPSGVKGIKSHLSMLAPKGNTLQRWWFVPFYEPLETNAEGTIFKLSGQRCKLMAQEEVMDSSGRRHDSATTRKSTERFAIEFTDHFPELAEKSPTFAELQNLYDLAVVGALIAEGQRHLGREALATLRSHAQLPQQAYSVPKFVQSESTFRMSNTGVMLGLVGGVTMDTQPVVAARVVKTNGPVITAALASPAASWWQDAAKP